MKAKKLSKHAGLAVSLESAKAHLKVDDATEDDLITLDIYAAAAVAEQRTGRVFIQETWEVLLPALDGDIGLAHVPVSAVLSVQYYDADNALQTLSDSVYELHQDERAGSAHIALKFGQVWPSTYPRDDAVKITYTAGYGTSEASIPQNARLWILMHVGTAYRMRESVAAGFNVSDLPSRYHDALLDSLKVYK